MKISEKARELANCHCDPHNLYDEEVLVDVAQQAEREIQAAFDAIESEAFKRGQESMRERAKYHIFRRKWAGAVDASDSIGNLPIKELEP